MTRFFGVAAVLACLAGSVWADDVSGTTDLDQAWGQRPRYHGPRDISGSMPLPGWNRPVSGSDMGGMMPHWRDERGGRDVSRTDDVSGTRDFDQDWGRPRHEPRDPSGTLGGWHHDVSDTDVSGTRPDWMDGFNPCRGDGDMRGPGPRRHGRDGADCPPGRPAGVSGTDVTNIKLFVLRYADGQYKLMERGNTPGDSLPATPAYPLTEDAAKQFCSDAGFSGMLGFNPMPKHGDAGEMFYITCGNQ